MRDPFANDTEFRKLLAGGHEIDLARLNLEFARDAHPGLDAEPFLGRIDALASRVADRCPAGAPPLRLIGQINWVLFVEEEYRGNVEDYGDPANSYLNALMDRKLGIPISLSTLYQALARRLGLSLSGVNLPAHYLLRLVDEPSPTFVDPFHSGRLLDLDACEAFLSGIVQRPVRLGPDQIAPCDPSTIASRMLRNLKAAYLERGDHAEALPVCRRLASLNPADLQEVRDWGMTSLQADRPGEALGPLGRYVAERPQAPDAESILGLLKAARREVAGRN